MQGSNNKNNNNNNNNHNNKIMYKKYRVSGRVQGVFYRKFTEKKANELGLIGFVQNLPNGDVMVCAKGDASQLDKFEAELRSGPLIAKVSAVTIILALSSTETDYLNKLTDFIIIK